MSNKIVVINKLKKKGKIKWHRSNNNVAIHVIKGEVIPSSSNSKYQVDGLSGATLTSRGVNNLVRYWLGNNGYGSFLNKLRRQRDA